MMKGHVVERCLLAFTALLLCLFPVASPASTDSAGGTSVTALRANAKLHGPDDILADFVNGEPETAVIVLLKPTAAATALATQAKVSAKVPAEFTAAGAPTFYNLRDESVKTQLRATVTESVDRVVNGLGTTGMAVTHKFAYQFGFSARVTPGALERIVNSPDVLSVEKDGVLEAHLAQGIPLMNGTTARNTYTGSGLSIAICDTGVDTSHPRLGGGGFPNAKVIGGYDTGDNDPDPRPDSLNGSYHGTACAGIAAGDLGTVGDYIGGVAPGAKIYAIKISTGTTGSATNSAMIAGWEWAVTHQNDDPNNPIMIISTSFGGGQFSSTCDSQSSSMTTAAANAVAAGITIFASSGNDGYCGSIAWPACISYVNSVGAVYDASFGTYYPCVNSASCALKTADSGCATGYYATDNSAPDKVTSYSNSASFLTLFAPANRAYTTTIVGRGDDPSGNYDTSFGGTSAACPYAAGAAAVLQQAAKARTGSYLTPAQVKSYLVSTGDSITDSKFAVTKPRVNLGNAINALPGGTPDFMIAASPTSVTAPTGGAGNTTITTTVSGGFSNAVALSASGLPAGVTASFNPASIAAPGSGTSTLTFTASAAAAIGTYNVTVTGAGGGKTHTATVSLTVRDGSGGSASITTTFAGGNSQNGNMFDVQAVSGPLTITKFDLNMADTAGTASIPVQVYYRSGTYVGSESTASAWTLLNSYTVTSAGTGNPTPMTIDGLTVPAGQTYGIYITRTDGLNLTYTTGANTYSDANIKVTLGAGIVYPFGSIYTPRTWNGTIYYNYGAATDFSLAAAPTSITLPQGGTGNSTVTTTVWGGFSSAVSLTVTGLPTGVTAAFNPASIAAPGSGTSTLTLTAGSAAPTGTYSVTVTGSGGGKTHSAVLTLTITAASATLFSNGFETGGWTYFQPTGTSATWNVVTAGTSPTATPHGGTQMAKFNSFSASSGDQALYYNTGGFAIPSNASAVTLSYWMYHDTGYSSAGDTVQAYVSTDGGSNFTSVGAAVPRYSATTGWSQASVDLGTYKGQANVRVGFLGTSGYGNNMFLDDVSVVAQFPAKQQLTVAVGGTGDCSVNSVPSAIACTKAGGTCTAGFDNGTSVTLTATPDINSLFGGWSGACTAPGGTCPVTMDAPKSVTATCSFVQPVRIPGTVPTYFTTLQSAFDAALNNNTIQARSYVLVENPILSRNIAVFLKGGHDSNYSSIIGTTTINGTLTIGLGSATVSDFAIH